MTADDAITVTDGHWGLGPCACPTCYVAGCQYCAALGCVRHFHDLRERP